MSAADARVRVLLVDDDEEDYLITRDLLLEAEGGARFRVEWIADYAGALDAMARSEHDVYLLDYRLGPHDGLQLMQEGRRRGCSGPVILLTGQGDRTVDVRAMEAGATDYLVKGELNARLLERSIRYAIERARVEQLRQSLLALASRELRGPLAAIKEQAIRLLLEDRGELAERAVDVTGHIIQTADHCARLLEGFVELSGLESVGTIGAEGGRFRVRSLVDEAIEAVQLAGHRCSCEVLVEDGLTEVEGDRYELLLVLAHLLANAAEHSPPGTAIRVSVSRVEDMVRFAVADRGPGIPADALEDLFTPFYLLQDPARRGARGTGLGLCHGKQVVEAHGGHMWVESVVGEGTIIYFEVPA
ncbi:MAG: response regulator [Armatimonadetes bacterium]|nr:response regulator [Armatimonadota bacterium]